MNKDYNPDDYKKEHEPKIAVGEELKIEVPIRRVMDCDAMGFAVFEFVNVHQNLWVNKTNKFFKTSEEAYAELGKMSQRLIIHNVPERYMKGKTHVPEKLTVKVTEYRRGKPEKEVDREII